jgi:tripartite-type tricarboxylate transporter receptor subunit TctC
MTLKAIALLLALSTTAAAQDYPARSPRLILPFAPGGSVDIVARLVAAKLGDRLGKQVVVENRTGAAGIIATELVANAAPDGYTLLLVSLAHAVNPWVYKPSYDPVRSFSFIASLGNGASVLAVHPSVPARTVQELIAVAKAKPREYAFAHAGIGSFVHTASVLFAMMAGIDTLMVPFRGGGPAMLDVIGGHTHMLMNSYLASVPHIRSGKLRGLGVTDTKRTPLLPDVPTIDEAGVKGYQAANWWGIAAPAGTPQPIVDRLHKEITAVLESEEIRKRFESDGANIVQMTPAEFTRFFQDELAKWGKVVKEANIKPE